MYIERKIYKKIKNQLHNNKIIILTGSRQVGKTTIMRKLMEEVAGKKAFLDMDIVSNREFGESLEAFLDFLILNGYEKGEKFCVFVDEFQKMGELATVFKNIYDHYPNIKIVASGSSSLSIKNNIKESLAGRKFLFEIYPLDFEEFLSFKKNNIVLAHYKNIQNLQSLDVDLPASFLAYLHEFLCFGGYPELCLAKGDEEKKMLLTSIFDLYLEKDIMNFSGIENIVAFKKLVEYLAVNNGQIVSYNKLAALLGIHNKTLRSYISLLEETYLIKTIRPFHTNKTKEIKKSPKIYFLDLGVRNFFLNNFNPLDKRGDKGQIWETYVLGELVKNAIKNIKFWRTKIGTEVDFVLDGEKPLPIELKYQSSAKKEDYSNLLNFLREYKLDKAYLLSQNRNQNLDLSGGKIDFVVAVNFLDKLK